MVRCIVALAAALVVVHSAEGGVFISTHRLAYTGQVQQFANLADAQASINALATFAIPDRVTAAPFDTPHRDAVVYLAYDYSGFDSAIHLLPAWFYTTQTSPRGADNPNFTPVGLFQLYDRDFSSINALQAGFTDFNGTHWTGFRLLASGGDAHNLLTEASNDDSTRLWHGDADHNLALATLNGSLLSYELDLLFGGLQGVPQGGGNILAWNEPTSVVGSLTGVFENTNAVDPLFNGFYGFSFTFSLDSWAYGNLGLLNGEDVFSTSYFDAGEFATLVALPLPGAAMMGMALVLGMASGARFRRPHRARRALRRTR